MSSAVRDSVAPALSSRLSSLRSLLSPPRLVCAISARTTTPRCTAAVSASSIASMSKRKMTMSIAFGRA